MLAEFEATGLFCEGFMEAVTAMKSFQKEFSWGEDKGTSTVAKKGSLLMRDIVSQSTNNAVTYCKVPF